MKIRCDKCERILGDYLYGKGGVEERAVIGGFRSSIRFPDVTCFDCYSKIKTPDDNIV